jgi:hypothetical protein
MNASTPPPPSDPWAPSVRAADVPAAEVDEPNPLDTPNDAAPGAKERDPNPTGDLSDEFKTTTAPLRPNKVDISRHLFELYPPAFVKHYPDAQVEIAYADVKGSEKPDAAKNFSVFHLQAAADFAEKKNIAGCNVYVGAALRNAKSNGKRAAQTF